MGCEASLEEAHHVCSQALHKKEHWKDTDETREESHQICGEESHERFEGQVCFMCQEQMCTTC